MSEEQEFLVGESSADEGPISIPAELPVLPLRDTVLFPNSFMPLAVARESSVRLIEEAIADSRLVGVFTQLDPAIEEPTQEELYPVGTATHIHKMFKLPDGTLRLIVRGQVRLHLDEVLETKPYIRAKVRLAEEILGMRTVWKLMRCNETSKVIFSRSSHFPLSCQMTFKHWPVTSLNLENLRISSPRA